MLSNLLYAIILTAVWLISWYSLTWVRYILIEDEEINRWKDVFDFFLPEVMCRLPGGEAYRFYYVSRKMEELESDNEDRFFGDDWYEFEKIRAKRAHDEIYFHLRGSHHFFWMREGVILVFGPVIILIALVLLVIGFLLEMVDRVRYSQQTPVVRTTR